MQSQGSGGGDDWGYGGDGYLSEEQQPIDLDSSSPRILLMGARRSGKSSMAGVVFNKVCLSQAAE